MPSNQHAAVNTISCWLGPLWVPVLVSDNPGGGSLSNSGQQDENQPTPWTREFSRSDIGDVNDRYYRHGKAREQHSGSQPPLVSGLDASSDSDSQQDQGGNRQNQGNHTIAAGPGHTEDSRESRPRQE